MKYLEEDFARDLHCELSRRFSALSPMINGAGVNWHCTIRQDDRECRIDCFKWPKDHQYYTSFKEDSQTIAYSRTSSRNDTLEAVADWLNGTDLSTLYDRYWFIDATKRRLVEIRDQAITAEPELHKSAESGLTHELGDFYHLFFRAFDRSCEVKFYGKNEWPNAKFSWDECQLFEYQPHDNAQFALVLRCWLCDRINPSKMRSKFPWLIIGELADYYEAGRPIEGEFIKSWDRVEEFYEETRCLFADEVKVFIEAMRSRGYYKTLRAGTSLWDLILSRSRRHGMRGEQPYILFEFRGDGMDVFNCIEDRHKGPKIVFSKIEFTPEIDALLDQLQSAPID